jgi:hypothetical protein
MWHWRYAELEVVVTEEVPLVTLLRPEIDVGAA